MHDSAGTNGDSSSTTTLDELELMLKELGRALDTLLYELEEGTHPQDGRDDRA